MTAMTNNKNSNKRRRKKRRFIQIANIVCKLSWPKKCDQWSVSLSLLLTFAAFNFNWINLKIDVYFTYSLYIGTLCCVCTCSCTLIESKRFLSEKNQSLNAKKREGEKKRRKCYDFRQHMRYCRAILLCFFSFVFSWTQFKWKLFVKLQMLRMLFDAMWTKRQQKYYLIDGKLAIAWEWQESRLMVLMNQSAFHFTDVRWTVRANASFLFIIIFFFFFDQRKFYRTANNNHISI